MRFNYCISNPAFNISEINNVAGTGGNTTLYRTATRNDFLNRLEENGTLINITLKGIIPDLLNGYFKKYQTNWIHLMDDINVWPYNTCIFSVSKKEKNVATTILGGLAAKIYSPDVTDCFPFVYYSGSNNGMDLKFGVGKSNRVIRQLPGKNRDSVTYDYTDVAAAHGPKFAFYVMESKKSYVVTSEPIYGGTICYIPTDSELAAEKLKLFTKKNPIFAEYVLRMKLRGHAFGLRNVKKFDLSQINTGTEVPTEWNITADDLAPPKIFTNEITEDRDRVKALGEVFTPTSLVNYTLDLLERSDPTAFVLPSLTFIDSMCGDGQFLVEILKRKIAGGSTPEQALSTIYGIDIMQDNVDLCRNRLLAGHNELKHIVERNITCGNSLTHKHTNDLFEE